ncbi:MAG: hypothetical protein QNK35_13870 [Bacteroides sp.]|nr:hypothetical protein [Bacteroides sp.]
MKEKSNPNFLSPLVPEYSPPDALADTKYTVQWLTERRDVAMPHP